MTQRERESEEKKSDAQRVQMRMAASEQPEPGEGRERAPWWLWTFIGLLVVGMMIYMVRYGGSFSGAVHEVEGEKKPVAAKAEGKVRGDVVFAETCQRCHQSHGLGVAGLYPPLAGSEWVVSDSLTPVRIVLHGLSGPLTAKGVRVNNTMPPLGMRLTDAEIAAVLTYVRASWGNAAPAVSAGLVETVRSKEPQRPPWTPVELEAMKAE